MRNTSSQRVLSNNSYMEILEHPKMQALFVCQKLIKEFLQCDYLMFGDSIILIKEYNGVITTFKEVCLEIKIHESLYYVAVIC